MKCLETPCHTVFRRLLVQGKKLERGQNSESDREARLARSQETIKRSGNVNIKGEEQTGA